MDGWRKLTLPLIFFVGGRDGVTQAVAAIKGTLGVLAIPCLRWPHIWGAGAGDRKK
jgi:hypothetical protein